MDGAMHYVPHAGVPDAPPQQRATGNSSYSASRKSGRRGDVEEHPLSAEGHLPSLPQLLPPLSEQGTPLWEASLPPRGYAAASRTADRETTVPGNQERQQQQRTDPAVLDGTAQLRDHRWKRRRTEQVSFASLHTEVFMYLDAAAATQQGEPSPPLSQSRAEEDAAVYDASSPSAPPPTHGHSSFTFTSASSHHSSPASLSAKSATAAMNRGSPPIVPSPRVAPPPPSVDAAVADTLRVLRACWEYRGAPHDAFEPVRLLSPISVHLLTTYGHHTLTQEGDYVVLRGGAEQLPWVGCLYGILQSYLCRRHHGTAEGSDAAHVAGISRVLLLNCHSFGWLDHVGTDEYERSHRRLYQAREALTSLLEEERYAGLGCPAACPLCSATRVGGDATTSVLLGDTIVMEGGAPSLGLASSSNTFTAHYQYGRGIACCVPEQRLPWHTRRVAGVAGGGGGNGGSRAGLCEMHHATHRASGERRRGSPRWSAQSEEELAAQGGQHLSPPSPLFSSPLTQPSLSLTHFPPVCCGTCRAAGVLGQALLLGPTGPLLIQLQFEEREWLEAAAPLLSGGPDGTALLAQATAAGAARRSACPIAEVTALCPAPLVNTASLRTDPAAALAAVLYAQMQGYGGAGTQPPPLATIAGGGSLPLAEFVEWLVRLLHAPPPALVVEWHSGAVSASGRASASPTAPGCSPELPSPSPSPNPEYAATGQPTFSSAPSADAPPPTAPPLQPPPPTPMPCAPLGMTVLPRPPVVPQLLETYADVMASRPPPRAFTVQSTTAAGAARRPGLPADRVAHSLQSSLARASAQVVGTDAVLPAWVMAARDGLRPCAATTYFDGVERPLVLAKGLEVVTEGERYVSAASVVTSLQFRPRLSGGGLGEYCGPTG